MCVFYVGRVQEELVLIFVTFRLFLEDHDLCPFQVHGQDPGLTRVLQAIFFNGASSIRSSVNSKHLN